MLKRSFISHICAVFILIAIIGAGCGGGGGESDSTGGGSGTTPKVLELSGSLSGTGSGSPGLGVERAAGYGTNYSVEIVDKDNVTLELGRTSVSGSGFLSSIPLSDTAKYAMVVVRERSSGRIIFENLLGKTPRVSDIPNQVKKISVNGLTVDENTSALAFLTIEKNAVPDIPIVVIADSEETFGVTITEDYSNKKSLFETAARAGAGGTVLLGEISKAIRTINAVVISSDINTSVKTILLEPSTKSGNVPTTTGLLKSFLNIIQNTDPLVQKLISDKNLPTSVVLDTNTITAQSNSHEIDTVMSWIVSKKNDTGQAPVLSPVSIYPELLRVGDTVSILFTADKDLYSTPNVRIMGSAVTAKPNGTRSYIASKMILPGDTNPVTFIISGYYDLNGNAGEQVTKTSDGSLSSISSEEQIVATPLITPEAGAYDNTQSVSISDATEGATIKYTLDGTDPSESHGTVYTKSFTINAAMMVKAVAIKKYWRNSLVASAIYTITFPALQVAAPTDPIADNKFNTFDWTNNPSYTAISNYEFSMNNGLSWTICTTKPIVNINGYFLAGWIKVRVIAGILGPAYPASQPISSLTAYTFYPAAPTAPVADDGADTFDWTNNPLFTSISDYEYSKNNGAAWTICTIKPQTGMTGNITTGWVKVRVKAGAAEGANEPAGAALSSVSAYAATPVPAPSA
ncbi:MAG TPA: chitobiase/beta-hexosaminidase C-terminal domain-containing protein, partial [Candidatus Wallbacteria bacterium]|nr:chitobiase/beta-hexosaminidase C-terminal domain-containing protein [Candidatus Wallbacteria bacterium]